MITNRLFVFLIILLLTIGLAACTRNLPAPEVTETTEIESVSPTDDIGQTLAFNLTQTAMAQNPQLTPGAPGDTPVVPDQPATDVTPSPIVAEPTATSPPIVVPTITVPGSYTLKGGEFPYCIARRFDVDPGELLRINGLSSTSVYYAGMNLDIPQSGRAFPGNRTLRAHPTTYTVQSGDTIYKIACYFGDVAPEGIAAANALTEPFKLTAGQTLNIP
jgi:LysM repeat protein